MRGAGDHERRLWLWERAAGDVDSPIGLRVDRVETFGDGARNRNRWLGLRACADFLGGV